MDRQIVYPGAIPLETDLLNTNKYAMIGLSKLAAAILGVSTFLNGLACTPNSPADLTVKVAPGEIYSLQNIDGTAYSSLAADTTHAILKQGISLDQLTLSCPAPVTVGQSINYLIQVAYQDTDANATVLPYYNSSNPSLAYSGPNNTGTAQNTVRKGVCAVSAKAGVSAATGSQSTPAPDAGYIGAFVVTVAYGQTKINAGNISMYAGAPFMPAGGLIVGGLQQNACISSVAGGTADALTGSFFPGITDLPASGAGVLTLYVRPSAANATTTPTFTPNSGVIAAKTIVKGAGAALAAGDIAGAGHWIELQYDATLDKWVLLNPATGIAIQSVKQLQTISASVAANALTLGLAANSLDFRSATLTNGAPNTRTFSALSLVVPSGATLGTVSGQSARLALIAIDNAGTVELAVANLAGGVNLDETTLISTTAISGTSNSAGVIYSTTARSNVPFRIVGFIDISEATAGTWASAPTLVQGAGGEALAALSAIGYGQTWQNLTGSRAFATTYYNTTGKPIALSIYLIGASGATQTLTVNGVAVAAFYENSSYMHNPSLFTIVPPGGSYSLTQSGGGTISTWNELR